MRLAYLDNLKVALVVGMIGVHVAIIYGVEGSFYLEGYDRAADLTVGLITVLVAVGFLFGLGAFFMIAGRLSGPSLDRKGPARFAWDRLLRLGLPVLFYVLAIAPVMEFVKARDEGEQLTLLSAAREQLTDPAPGPTWFLEALLVFSLVYAAIRALRPSPRPPSREPLRGRQVAAVGAAIAVLSFANHLVFPIGEEHLHIQPALFPQYAILFALGCAAGRRGWLESLSPELRRGCGIAGLAAVSVLPLVLLAGDFADREELFAGGWHWQAAATSLIEGVLAASLPLFLIGWSREHWTRQGRLLRRMSPAAYGAFIIHPPLIVGAALLLHDLAVPADLKLLTVLAVGVAGSFGITALALRASSVNRVIGSGPRPHPATG